jgi:hypothetical protein
MAAPGLRPVVQQRGLGWPMPRRVPGYGQLRRIQVQARERQWFLFSRSSDSLPTPADPATHPPSPVQAHYSAELRALSWRISIHALEYSLTISRLAGVCRGVFPSFWSEIISLNTRVIRVAPVFSCHALGWC